MNREMDKEEFSKPSINQPRISAAQANMRRLSASGSSSDEDRLRHLIAASHQPDFAGLEASTSDDSLRQFLVHQQHLSSQQKNPSALLLPKDLQQMSENTMRHLALQQKLPAKQNPPSSLLLPKDLQHMPENTMSAARTYHHFLGSTNTIPLESNSESLYNLKLTQFEGHQSSAIQDFSLNQSSAETHNLNSDILLPPRLKRKMDESTEVIDQADIQHIDVLLERGGRGNHHEGSKHYRRLINENRDAYQCLTNGAKAEKMAISVSIIQALKNTGARFIHKKEGQYIIMNDREARNKISQALREKKKRVMLDD